MAEKLYRDSNYRFTDPIRFFKANDPYYFEVDNIPLKQLQENCMWLKDQIRSDTVVSLTKVKRADIEELRPFSNGTDRVVRVSPGRYTARINDASTRTPLAYLRKVLGEAITDLDAWEAVAPNSGDLPGNELLEAALDKFKQAVSEDALGMNGLVERAFTWPVVDVDRVVAVDGAKVDSTQSWLTYAGPDVNTPGGGATRSPFLITEALLWAKSRDSLEGAFALPSFEFTNPNSGWAKFPLTESYFIKAWRGISRTAIVDVDEELEIEIPQFDADDFSYTNNNGDPVAVDNVQQRIDLVFIYSKPVDASAVQIIRGGSVEKITKPALGVVKGAGIRANFQAKITDIAAGYKVPTNDSILAAPGDQYNESMGFTSTSGNDIGYSVRGSFPSPDDLLNIAPLISQNLEDNAYELIGQSILPVAYVFVQGNSQVVLPTDVIDIRPLFRTAELTYNERAGIGAAFPQLSLANPAVGKSHLDHEIKRLSDDVNGRIADQSQGTGTRSQINTLAMGYVFGGLNFGPEGAIFDFKRNRQGVDGIAAKEDLKSEINSTYSFGSTDSTIDIPDLPDWDVARWVSVQGLPEAGDYPNDYLTTFLSSKVPYRTDRIIVAASNAGKVDEGQVDSASGRFRSFINAAVSDRHTNVYFHYVSKKIKFERPSWLADYNVDVNLVNCVPQNNSGARISDNASYFGVWVEKGQTEFTIYVAFTAQNPQENPRWPQGGEQTTTIQRGGGRFSGWIVPTAEILYSNDAVLVSNSSDNAPKGYRGMPRIGKCTLPTVMWKMTGISEEDRDFLYGNLTAANSNNVITLKGGDE